MVNYSLLKITFTYLLILIFRYFVFYIRYQQSLSKNDPMRTLYAHLHNKDVDYIKVSEAIGRWFVICSTPSLFATVQHCRC